MCSHFSNSAEELEKQDVELEVFWSAIITLLSDGSGLPKHIVVL